MMKPLIWVAALAAVVSTPTAAAACELDGLPGMPGMGGMHRFNPFAKALRALPGGEDPARPQEIRSSYEAVGVDREDTTEQRNSPKEDSRRAPKEQRADAEGEADFNEDQTGSRSSRAF